MRKQITSLAALAAAGILGYAAPANAVLVLTADVGGVLFSCADQAACDNNPTVGQLGLGSAATPLTINGVDVFGSLHRSGPNLLSSSSLQVINNSGAARDITVAVGAIDFAGPISGFSASGSGTFLSATGSDISLRYFIDAANAQGGEGANDTPGDLVSSFDYTAAENPDSFSHTDSGALAIDDPYSMTLQFLFNLDAGGALTSRGQVIITNVAVPEPVSLALLGTGLLGLAFATRRRSRP